MVTNYNVIIALFNKAVYCHNIYTALWRCAMQSIQCYKLNVIIALFNKAAQCRRIQYIEYSFDINTALWRRAMQSIQCYKLNVIIALFNKAVYCHYIHILNIHLALTQLYGAAQCNLFSVTN